MQLYVVATLCLFVALVIMWNKFGYVNLLLDRSDVCLHVKLTVLLLSAILSYHVS